MSEWHPVLAAVEREPGVWTLVDTLGQDYARIALRRTPEGPRYRTEQPIGTLIGWGTSLRQSCDRAHALFLARHGPGRFPGYPSVVARYE